MEKITPLTLPGSEKQIRYRNFDEACEKLAAMTEILQEHTDELKSQNHQLSEQTEQLKEQTEQLKVHSNQLDDHNEKLDVQNEQLEAQTVELKTHNEQFLTLTNDLRHEAVERTKEDKKNRWFTLAMTLLSFFLGLAVNHWGEITGWAISLWRLISG